MPSSPITLNLVDVSGDTTIAQPMIEAYIKAYPQYLKSVNFTTGDATQITSKLQAQQQAGTSQIDLVLTGNDALAAGIQAGTWLQLLPAYNDQLGASVATYQPDAKKLLDQADGYALVNDFGDYGPMLEYLPNSLAAPLTTPQQLLDWAKANPGKFEYAEPANSGPGRAFVQGLPYALGDSDPTDPVNGWTKTWAYLSDLGQYITAYPSGTTATMQDLANGTMDIVATTAGWDINARAIGTVPKDAQISAFDNTSWIMDANFVAVPKGISDSHLAVVLDLLNWMLAPEQQAMAYDDGYMYPGPSVQGVTLSMAPAASQQTIQEFGRPEYDTLLPQYPAVTPLSATNLATMFSMWDQQIGAGKQK
ncbi:MAG: extracellular solute-binding protein [Propionibacteriaceae bacterium]|nr:extracellular solute-binding protein [Propionibacteriaceae bacterium]